MNCPTPHISAEYGDFAKTVIMPGDPLRAKFIAENFLSEARLVNKVRGMLGYTGQYKGVPVSVMASGMGMPSMGIYSYELFNAYGVENIIRAGTAGAISDKVTLRQLVIIDRAVTNSAFSHHYKTHIKPQCSPLLLKKARAAANSAGINSVTAPVFTSDIFYFDNDEDYARYAEMGAVIIDMETAALYMTAQRYGKNALSVCTVSDNVLTGQATTSAERETSFTDMIRLALETAKEL